MQNKDAGGIKNISADMPLYPIRVAAKLLGISIPLLRLYEIEGFVLPYKKESKQRLYSQLDIDRLACVRKAITERKIGIAGVKMAFAMIPCWKIKGCSKADREKCEAYTSSEKPCWSYKHFDNVCETSPCSECPVYRDFTDCNHVKSAIIEHTNNNGKM